MGYALEVNRWYACEFIGDEFEEDKCSYSPIRVEAIEPLNTGNSVFRLSFHHANYPEGVRSKVYTLRTEWRGASFILARSIDHNPARFLQVYDIGWPWILKHFPETVFERIDIQEWLNRHV